LWVFGYTVAISNLTDRVITLRTRRWTIIDAHGERHDAGGPGVVGQEPRMEPGETFEYSSYCPLRTAWGTMEGLYTFEVESAVGEVRLDVAQVQIGRFFLVADDADAGAPCE
jgi:ApaG protein